PTLVGFVASANDGRLSAGLSAAMIFPVLMLAGLMTLKKARNTG
ncbi:MAG: MFS transporter, partial [Clostridiaceae bacterium]|nr:MFS transporter [Clostridiaceae bacterium]